MKFVCEAFIRDDSAIHSCLACSANILMRISAEACADLAACVSSAFFSCTSRFAAKSRISSPCNLMADSAHGSSSSLLLSDDSGATMGKTGALLEVAGVEIMVVVLESAVLADATPGTVATPEVADVEIDAVGATGLGVAALDAACEDVTAEPGGADTGG